MAQFLYMLWGNWVFFVTVSLFGLLLYVLINSYGLVGTLSPFYVNFCHRKYTLTSKCDKNLGQTNADMAICEYMLHLRACKMNAT